MSGVNQIKEQNEKIIALLGERQPAQERPSKESSVETGGLQPGEEGDRDASG
jgi:hypothetical protein